MSDLLKQGAVRERPPTPLGRALRWFAGLWTQGSRQAVDRAELKAEQAEARLRAAVDALPEGVVFLDHEGRYILWNKRYAEIYHRSADLFERGARLIDTLRVGVARGDYPDAIGREEQWIADRMALMDNPGVRHEQRVADGRWLMIEERRTDDGGIIGLRIDITHMKRQAEELEAALSRAEAASRAKSEFLANLSHEIRTPLNGVIGLADMLSRTPLDASQCDLLKTIAASAGALNGILADLLDFSRLEAGKLEIVNEPFLLAETVREAAALFAGSARERGLTFDVEIAPSAEVGVMGDATRLKQILTNLLSNALKFTQAGRISVTVSAGAKGDRCYFEVRDTGIGFEPDDAERLFSRFEQADGSITRKYGGTGLGLAICRQLAGLMGGTISAAGQPGRGAVFTLTLPMVLAAPPIETIQPAEDAASAEGMAIRVLVVDDNPVNRQVAELILHSIGAEVLSAENGLQGVEAAAAGAFDLVLMDLQMPVMDGLTAIRTIRAREASMGLVRTPILVLSANVMREHVEASTAVGADGHVGKPIRADQLIGAVAEVLRAEPPAAKVA